MSTKRTPAEQAVLKAKLEELRKAKEAKAKPKKQKLNYSKMMEDHARVDSGGGSEFFRASQLPKGQTRMRFLMNPDDDSFYGFRVGGWIPNNNPDDQQKADRYTSPLTDSPTGYCPVKRMSDALKRYAKVSDDPARRAIANKLSNDFYPRSEFMSNVLIFKPETKRWEPCIFQYGVSIYKALVADLQANLDSDDIVDGEVSDEMNFASDKYGKIVVISKSGEGLNTRYTVTITAKTKECSKEELDGRKSLAEYCSPDSAEELEAMLCDLFQAGDMDTLLNNLDDVVFPGEDVKQNKETCQVKSSPEPDEELTEDEEEELEEAVIPECIGSFGNPEGDNDCETCPYAEECKTIEAAS